jgi:hypothetical protein
MITLRFVGCAEVSLYLLAAFTLWLVGSYGYPDRRERPWIFWLAGACGAWAANVAFISMLLTDDNLVIVGRILLTTANSVCLIAGTVSFQASRGTQIPRLLRWIASTAGGWALLSGVLFASTFLADRATKFGSGLYKVPDLIVSAFTITLLGWTFPLSFWRNKDRPLFFLSSLVLAGEVFAQYYQNPNPQLNREWIWCLLTGSGAGMCALFISISLPFGRMSVAQEISAPRNKTQDLEQAIGVPFFPQRAAWLERELARRSWTKYDLAGKIPGNLDHKTIQKFLRVNPSRRVCSTRLLILSTSTPSSKSTVRIFRTVEVNQ